MWSLAIVGPDPRGLGGIERVAYDLANAVARRAGVPVRYHFVPAPNPRRDLEGGAVELVPARARGAHSVPWDLVAAVARETADVVHLHSVAQLHCVAGLRADRRARLIVSPHYHRRASTLLFQAARPVFDAIVVAPLLRRASALVLVSHAEAGWLRARFPRLSNERQVVVPNGVDARAIRAVEPMLAARPYALYLGRLDAYKNVDRLVRSVPHMEMDLVIVGDGREAARLRALAAELAVAERVHFMGAISDQEKASWLRGASVVVNLSSIEAFGVTILEAMAAGVPALVEDAGGLAELARRFPDTVTAVHSDALVPAELGAALGHRARAGFVDVDLASYAWGALAARMERIYRGDLT